MNLRPVSVFASYITDFITLKQSVGYKYTSIDVYRQFDNFATENEITEPEITRELCDVWCAKRPNEEDRTRLNRIVAVRNLAKYMLSINLPAYIPPIPGGIKPTFTPHIFSQDELNRIFAACDTMNVTSLSATAPLIPALFRFLYGTGARSSEAFALLNRDIDLVNGVVTLRETKNGQERILPMTDSLKNVMIDYTKSGFADSAPNAHFFTKRNGTPLVHDSVYHIFRLILKEAGISYRGRKYGPRVHDFRHSFAVHSLAKLANDGVDLYYAMPFLAKYLGHNSLESTDEYVRLTEEMYPSVLEKVNKISACVFPDVKGVYVA